MSVTTLATLTKSIIAKCQECGKQSESPLKYCSKCQVAAYCSRDCQVGAWTNGHKGQCKQWRTLPGQGLLAWAGYRILPRLLAAESRPFQTTPRDSLPQAPLDSTILLAYDIFIADLRYGKELAGFLTAVSPDASSHLATLTSTLNAIQTHVICDHTGNTVKINETSKVPLLSSDGCTSYLASVLDLAHRAQECVTLEWSRIDTDTPDNNQAASSEWNTDNVARVFDVIAQWLLRASYWVSVGGDADVFKNALSEQHTFTSLAEGALSTTQARERALALVETDLVETVLFKSMEYYYIGICMFADEVTPTDPTAPSGQRTAEERRAALAVLASHGWFAKGIHAQRLMVPLRKSELHVSSKKPVDPALQSAVKQAMAQQAAADASARAEGTESPGEEGGEKGPKRETEELVARGIYGTINALASGYVSEIRYAAWHAAWQAGVRGDTEDILRKEAEVSLQDHIDLVQGPLAGYNYPHDRSAHLLNALAVNRV